MRRLVPVALLACAVSLLAGCQMSGPGQGQMAVPGTNPVTGDAIEVTALDAAPAEVEPESAKAAAAEGAPTAAAQSAPGPQASPVADPATVDADAAAVAEVAIPAPKPDLEAIPVTPKSDQQLACEKKKGRWARIGKGEARACVFQTRDAGKRCTKESQCDGVCLARSGTCSPFKPLYGCNEILQDNGMRVTLCLD
ncbi:MAG: hypothetical protein EON48_14090 [Acetobacteraceae bacterium]|nr:MAG: hypothetical protein EON48_14090 [Acetobacteraceae bacterium]